MHADHPENNGKEDFGRVCAVENSIAKMTAFVFNHRDASEG
jgi:hypothetical protein